MATLTIRNLDDEVKERLRRRAAANRRSMEEEARAILRNGVLREPPAEGLGTRIHKRFLEIGGVELEVPPRGPARPLPDIFDDE